MPPSEIRILDIIPYRLFPVRSGGQRHILKLDRALQQYLTCHLGITADTPMTESDVNMHVVLGKGLSRYLSPWSYFRIRKLVQAHTFTHLVFQHPYLGWLMALCKWTLPVQVIVRSHNIEATRFQSLGRWWWRILALYEAWVYRTAHQVWFITENDRQFSIQHYGVKEHATAVFPCGVDPRQLPDPILQQKHRYEIRKKHGLPEQSVLILFHGALSYSPNLGALRYLLEEIFPAIQSVNPQACLLICGAGLSDSEQDKILSHHPQVIYAGFVDAIEPYLMAADLMINPMLQGGGMQTKLIESLGYGLPCISSMSGAIGVDPDYCSGKLLLVKNRDTEAYVKAFEAITTLKNQTTMEAFYQQYQWTEIAGRIQHRLKTSV